MMENLKAFWCSGCLFYSVHTDQHRKGFFRYDRANAYTCALDVLTGANTIVLMGFNPVFGWRSYYTRIKMADPADYYVVDSRMMLTL